MKRFVALTFASSLILPGFAAAQNFPTKPIHIITAEVGGGSDLVARMIAQEIAGPLGQQIVVENRPANAGELVAKAAPDGYTLLLYGSTIWTAQLIRPVAWDPLKDFSAITMVIIAPNILVVNPSLPVKSVKELVALARSRPGDLNYASSGTGSATHLSGELFKTLARINIVRINYKGAAPAINDVIGGRVELMIVSASSVTGHMKSGKLRALAVTNAQPSALFPNLPTIAASGVPGYESVLEVGMFAPAKTPSAIVNRVNQEIARQLRRTEIKEKFFAAGLEPVGDTPEEFAATVKADIAKWGKLIKDARIKEE